MNGNLKWFGEFDECLNIKSGPLPNDLVLTPRYCLLFIGTPNGSALTNVLAGFCVTDNCDTNVLADIVNPIRKSFQWDKMFFFFSVKTVTVANLTNGIQIFPNQSICKKPIEEVPYNTAGVIAM